MRKIKLELLLLKLLQERKRAFIPLLKTPRSRMGRFILNTTCFWVTQLVLSKKVPSPLFSFVSLREAADHMLHVLRQMHLMKILLG